MGSKKEKTTAKKAKNKTIDGENVESGALSNESYPPTTMRTPVEDGMTSTTTDTSASESATSSFYRKRRNKRDQGSLDQGARNYKLGPAIHTPDQHQEPSFERVNALQDINSTRIPKADILESFPNEQAWRELHNAARESYIHASNRLMSTILYHSCIKNNFLPSIIRNGELLAQNMWPYTALSAEIKHNQFEWLDWLACMAEAMPHAIKQYNWMTLLQREYDDSEKLWKRFWEVHCRDEGAKEACEFTYKVMPPKLLLKDLEEVETQMAVFNRRRVFLQGGVMAERDAASLVFTNPPRWYDWTEEAKHILISSGQFQLLDGYESGFIYDPEDDEASEEFEM